METAAYTSLKLGGLREEAAFDEPVGKSGDLGQGDPDGCQMGDAGGDRMEMSSHLGIVSAEMVFGVVIGPEGSGNVNHDGEGRSCQSGFFIAIPSD